jgi:hypothetical protein
MILGSQKSNLPFTRYKIWSLYIGYLNTCAIMSHKEPGTLTEEEEEKGFFERNRPV